MTHRSTLQRARHLRFFPFLGALLLACFTTLGCNRHSMIRPNTDLYRPPSEVSGGTEFFVGAASRDVTPPAGASLAGHGPGGRVSMGHWTRLYCRAFYIEPVQTFLTKEAGSPLAMVICDLPYVSTLLVRRTMAELDKRRKRRDVPADLEQLDATRLLIAAIHTHAGPAHYFDVRTLGGFASSQFPGYDDAMVDFLARRIADALVDAHAVKQLAELRWLRSTAFSFSRNSALRQFLLNDPPPYIPPCNDKDSPVNCKQLGPEELNIDPHLRLLEFRNSETKLMIGAIGFYALHPTFIGNRNRHYGSDIFGIVTRNMEQELRRELNLECDAQPDPKTCKDAQPVFALFNTNQADAQARRVSGTETEVIYNGALLSEAVWKAHCSSTSDPSRSKLCQEGATPTASSTASAAAQPPAPSALPVPPNALPATPNTLPAAPSTQDPGAKFAMGTSSPTQASLASFPDDEVIIHEDYRTEWTKTPVINSRYVDVHLPGETVKSPTSNNRATMDKTGQLGIASTRGSLSNPSAMLFLMPQTIETFNYKRKTCRPLQTPKQFMPFAKGVAKTVPFALLQLGHAFISFVPGEITLAVGQMINDAVLKSPRSKAKTTDLQPKAPVPKHDAVIVGLANGYMNYVTTRQEYALQAYHGSSTVYGIQSAHFLTYTFECLARHLNLDHEKCQISGVVGKATEFSYTTGPGRQRFWREKWDKRTNVVPELNKMAACRLENTSPPVLCFRWEDEGPYSVSLRDWLVRVQAKKRGSRDMFVALEVDTAPLQGQEPREPDHRATSLVDDRGAAFLTQVLFRQQGAWNWSTLFSPSSEVWKQMKDKDYRFEINQGEGKAPLYSPSLREISACTPQMINEYCTTDP